MRDEAKRQKSEEGAEDEEKREEGTEDLDVSIAAQRDVAGGAVGCGGTSLRSGGGTLD
jgi:hypothetical protein